MEELVSNTKIAMWLIGILLTIISALMGFVLWYIKDLILQAKGLNGKISNNSYQILDLKQKHTENMAALCASEKSMWSELHKLRRAVVSGTMVLKRRRKETDEILEDQRRFKSELAKHEKILRGHHLSIKSQRHELDLTRTKIEYINDELFILKENRKSKKQGQN